MGNYSSNLKFLNDLANQKADVYRILSFLEDTIDAMRTDTQGLESPPDSFYDAVRAITNALQKIDEETI